MRTRFHRILERIGYVEKFKIKTYQFLHFLKAEVILHLYNFLVLKSKTMNFGRVPFSQLTALKTLRNVKT